MHPTARYMMDVPYPMLGRVEHYIKTAPLIVEDKTFAQDITFTFVVRVCDEQRLTDDITQLSEGRLEPLRFDEMYMAWPEEAQGNA